MSGASWAGGRRWLLPFVRRKPVPDVAQTVGGDPAAAPVPVLSAAQAHPGRRCSIWAEGRLSCTTRVPW